MNDEVIKIIFHPSEYSDEELSNLSNSLDKIGLYGYAKKVENYVLNRKSIRNEHPKFNFKKKK